ncbi:MAG: conjugal transfer protein TraF [Candidatus Zixiibacteriota bacterium]|nr:MAG: conjugal transfer protein TraF [candidate division Zixibacteria bacterium]
MKAKIFIYLIIIGLVALSANAAGLSSARAVAMGGAYIGLAKGVYAPLYNPANIGLSGYKEYGVEIASAGAEIANNSFTLSDYNKYTGAVLTEEDKSVILGKIPSEGLKISAEAEAGALSASLNSLVISINGNAATEVNLGKDALELFLMGNQINDSFSLGGMYSEAIAYISVGLSYGRPVYKFGTRQLAVGGTVKYIKGLAYEKVTELHGGVVTLITGFQGDGTMIAHTAEGGNGYGIDVGAALKLSDSYTAGLTFSNLLSHISWNTCTEEHGYHFEFDAISLEDMDNDSIIVTDDYSIDIPGFGSRLPVVMRTGVAKTDGKILWAVDYIQGFRLAAGSSTKPRIAAGGEYRPFRRTPVRAGLALGGGKRAVFSLGFGFELPVFYMDIALSNNSTLAFNATKGLHLALSTGLKF